MAKDAAKDRGRRFVPSGSRAMLVLTLVAVGVVVAMYYAYYRSQIAYYTGRNLRLLSMLSAQVEGRVDMFAGFVRSKAPEAVPLSVKCETWNGSEKVGIEQVAGAWQLRLREGENCAAVGFEQLLRPVFARRVGAAFDMLLVADAAGTVLYSVRPPGASSNLLRGGEEEPTVERISGSMHQLKTLTALQRRTGWRKYEDLKPDSFANATHHEYVALDGTDYVLFAQPYTLVRGPAAMDATARQWIVVGLVSASRFRYDVSAVSASIVLLALAVALLAICSWPFLRIALIDPRDALTITDVVLIVNCTIVAAAVITLALLDGFAYQGIVRNADRQLARFGDGINADFGANVVRAMTVLDRVQALTSTQPKTPGAQVFPDALKNDPVVGEYPYIDTISWIDAAGQQQVKFASSNTTPLLSVVNRRYFQDAKRDATWSIKGRPYVLEWVRSMATGETRAVLAKQTRNAQYPVLAMSTELIDVTHAIAPAGVELAIIDEDGDVVYHSDTQRIGYENFFAEADRNRELRSAVVARRAGHVKATYWGEDQSMYVRPLDDSPWTLIVFRAKRLTRVLNVEAALLTLIMLLLSATPYLLIYIAVLIVAPRYRAPRLWPDASRWGDYFRLAIVIVVLMIVSGLNSYVLTPWSSFYGVLFIPVIAILTTYLMLHRTGAPRRFAIAAAMWTTVTAITIGMMAIGDVDTELEYFAAHQTLAKTLLLSAAIGAAALTVLLLTRFEIPRLRVSYTVLYRLCGVLLLLVGVALPVVGFFRISRHVEAELLVKYSQLRAAADLEHRIHHLETTSIRPARSPSVDADVDDSRFCQVFGSAWSLDRTPAADARCKRNDTDWTIPASAATWLPALYEDSIAIRPLFSSASTDDLWHWCLRGRYVELVRKIRLEPAVAQRVWGAVPAEQSINITSKIPFASLTKSLPLFERWTVVLLISLPLLAVFWYAADFIARRVLLFDITEPVWMTRLPLSPTLGDHIFLVRRDRDVNALTGPDPMGKGLPFYDVSFAELDAASSPPRDWTWILETLDSSDAGRNVRIVDFEYGINDEAINQKKLQWLERLLALPDRTVVIASTVSPAYIMTAAPASQDRWRALLERFVWISAEDLELRRDRVTSPPDEPRTWLDKEMAYNPFLRRLREELDENADRRHLLDEICERAETYYSGLWSSCHEDEKLLLYHLAQNGLANGRNRRVLRRLIARGLVRRDPNLELFSDTFRLYVLHAAKREDLVTVAREQRGASTWDSLRVPFFVVIISFLLLLFGTQKDLLTTTTTIATALTTGLPLVMKLLGIFTEQRLDKPV